MPASVCARVRVAGGRGRLRVRGGCGGRGPELCARRQRTSASVRAFVRQREHEVLRAGIRARERASADRACTFSRTRPPSSGISYAASGN
eukprot:5116104-Pleurochrysis_carterae.AAC.2